MDNNFLKTCVLPLAVKLGLVVIPYIAGYFTHIFQQYFLEKRTRLKERFEKLYAPFDKMIWLQTKGAFSFSDLAPELQHDFIKLLFTNYEYADSKLKTLLMHFKWAYDSEDFEESDKFFFLIEKRISETYNVFSKKLFLEPFCMKKVSKTLKEFKKLP